MAEESFKRKLTAILSHELRDILKKISNLVNCGFDGHP